MSTTPPQIPPDIAESSVPDFNRLWSSLIDNASSWLPVFVESSKVPISGLAAEIAAALVELSIEITSEIGRRVGESVDEFEKQAGPEIERAAAVALSDYFNVPISVSNIQRNRSQGAKFAFGQQLGNFVLESLFGAFQIPQKLTPEAGRENAERILGFNIGTTIEGWLGKVVSSTPLTRWIPNWADLDTVMSQALGLGRINRRILGPLLRILVADPFAWDLNRRFTPAKFSAADLVRLRNRKLIDDGVFFEEMSFLGWSNNAAGKMRSLRSRLPAQDDIAKMLELGTISEERARAIYEGLGFTETGAEAMIAVTRDDRVRSLNNNVESTARDMFRDREIDEAELRSLLSSAGRSSEEVELVVALALIQRARPRSLPRGVIEEGFRKALIPLSRLREYYRDRGFSLEDQVLLEELAMDDRQAQEERDEAAREKAQTNEFKAVPRAQIEKAFIDGLVSGARLREYYDERGFGPDDVGVLLELATRRKAEADRKREEALAAAQEPDFRSVPRSSIEEAFARGLITESRLSAWYIANNFAPPEVPILLGNARARKQEREEALADELRRANRDDFRDLPRSVMEEAFIRDIVDERRLLEYYRVQEFRDAEIPVLLELVGERKADRQASKAKASAGPAT